MPAIQATAAESSEAQNPNMERRFNDRFVLLDDVSGQPLVQAEYAIKRESGELEHGTTDEEGHTHLLSETAQAEAIEIYV